MALPNPRQPRPRIDVAQLVTRGIRLELTISEDGAPAELVTAVGTDRLMMLSALLAQGYELKTTGADAVGPHTVDTLIRIRRPQPSQQPQQ